MCVCVCKGKLVVLCVISTSFNITADTNKFLCLKSHFLEEGKGREGGREGGERGREGRKINTHTHTHTNTHTSSVLAISAPSWPMTPEALCASRATSFPFAPAC